MTNYVALLDRTDEGEVGVIFPDLPGCTSGGTDTDEAIQNAAEALATHVELMREIGETVPPARSAAQIEAAPDDWYDVATSVVALVPLLPATHRSVRINVTMDERLLARIDRVASNRSAFLAEAAEAALGKG